MSHTPPAPGQLYELREWLVSKIDGAIESYGEDSLISSFINQIDALNDQVRSLTRPKTIAEWQAAKAPTPASKTQVKRFAAQMEPKGCPTPGACSYPDVDAGTQLVRLTAELAEQTRLRQMAEHERDAMLEELIAARKVISEMTAGVSEWAQAWKESK